MNNHEQWLARVSAYADGECSPEEREQIEAHLEECAQCREWLEQIEADREQMVQAVSGRHADIKDSVMERVTAMSAPEEQKQTTTRWRLVEVLVAVGILAVLAAVLFPVFARSRDKARVTSCLSNVKQISLAMMMYAKDYDGYLPNASTWTEDLMPYCKNEAIFQCPTEPLEPSSYAMVRRWSEANLEDIPDRDQTVLIYEANRDGTPAFRHHGGLNVGFADGHAKWYSEEDWETLGVDTTAIHPGLPDRNYGLRRQLKLAYDAAMEVWVQDIHRSLVSAEKVFYDRGGFILRSTLDRGTCSVQADSAEIVGKVPTEEVGATVNALGALGYVVHRELVGEDLTDQYTQHSREITQKSTEMGRVDDRREDAPRSKKPAFDRKISETRTQLGHAQDNLFNIRREIVLSTISATLRERPADQPQERDGGVLAAWNAFRAAAIQLGIWLVWVGLFGLLGVPFIALGTWIYRRRTGE